MQKILSCLIGSCIINYLCFDVYDSERKKFYIQILYFLSFYKIIKTKTELYAIKPDHLGSSFN